MTKRTDRQYTLTVKMCWQTTKLWKSPLFGYLWAYGTNRHGNCFNVLWKTNTVGTCGRNREHTTHLELGSLEDLTVESLLLMPSVSIAQVRRQSIFQPDLPAESTRPASPSASAKVPSRSGSAAKGTPPGTIVALTVAAVILFVAFGLLFAYIRRRYREEISRDGHTVKGAKGSRRPESPSKPDDGETHVRDGDIMRADGPETSGVPRHSNPIQISSSGSSSASSSSYFSFEDGGVSYTVPERSPQRPTTSNEAPQRNPSIRAPRLPTPRYPKPVYSPQPGRYPGVSRDPRAPPTGNQDSRGGDGTRPTQSSPSSRSPGQLQGFGPTGNDRPSMPSPSLADVLPSDIPGPLSTGTYTAALRCY